MVVGTFFGPTGVAQVYVPLTVGPAAEAVPPAAQGKPQPAEEADAANEQRHGYGTSADFRQPSVHVSLPFF